MPKQYSDSVPNLVRLLQPDWNTNIHEMVVFAINVQDSDIVAEMLLFILKMLQTGINARDGNLP